MHALTTDTAVTVWWEKAEKASEQYEILFNGAQCCTTAATHFTWEGLQPDTEYTVEVAGVGAAKVRTRRQIHRLDVTQAPYFAKGDGATLNTAAIQRAIDDCGAEECVYLPAGVYRTGALRLHSRMALCVAEGAVLQGTQTIADYEPRIPSRFEGIECVCYSSLLNIGSLDHDAAPNCEDVLIYGGGTIAGGGSVLARRIIEDERVRLKAYLAELGDKVLECENLDTIPGRARGRLINMSNCRNIRITGLTLADGPCWNVHMVYSDHIVTDHCVFRSKGVWNGDGWDPDSSEDCTLFACRFYTGDDAVAIKSGKNPEGNLINRPTRRIRIFDCISCLGHGITIGSEMSGGVEDVRIWDCDLGRAKYGIEIKGTKKRGGYVRNVQVRDCTVARILMHAVGYNDDGIGASAPPKFSGCRFENVRILGRSFDHEGAFTDVPAIELEGFDELGYEVEDVAFRQCAVEREAEIRLNRCKRISVDICETK